MSNLIFTASYILLNSLMQRMIKGDKKMEYLAQFFLFLVRNAYWHNRKALQNIVILTKFVPLRDWITLVGWLYGEVFFFFSLQDKTGFLSHYRLPIRIRYTSMATEVIGVGVSVSEIIIYSLFLRFFWKCAYNLNILHYTISWKKLLLSWSLHVNNWLDF